MNENDFYDRDFPFKNRCRNYGEMPELTSVEEIRKQESMPLDLRWYSTSSKEFDEFLRERFGHNIEEFRKLYLGEHMPKICDCSEKEILMMARYVNPIPKTMRVYFQEVHSLCELMFKSEQCKKMIVAHSHSGPFPLHNDTISNFTIIRARFSGTESLEQSRKGHFFGYYFADEKFRFFISSSMQLDLTVIYEEI